MHFALGHKLRWDFQDIVCKSSYLMKLLHDLKLGVYGLCLHMLRSQRYFSELLIHH
jgi:hypothetical protein